MKQELKRIYPWIVCIVFVYACLGAVFLLGLFVGPWDLGGWFSWFGNFLWVSYILLGLFAMILAGIYGIINRVSDWRVRRRREAREAWWKG